MAEARKRSRSRNRGQVAAPAVRNVNYRQIENKLALTEVFSADQVETLHQASLTLLADQGLKVLLPEAREIFKRAGAKVDEDSQMVWLPRDIITEAVSKAPKSFQMRGLQGANRDLTMGGRSLVFGPGAGCPNVNDLVKGRRPGDMEAFVTSVKLVQHFDVMGMNVPTLEPQDIPLNVRHCATMDCQLKLSDKIPFVFARGTGQVEDAMEAVRIARGLSQDEFEANVWINTVINTNSPRQLDIPMSQGIIDFAKYNQVSVITPFCLSGAMAPISIAGALTLSHAEAMAGIALAQLVRPGAPVVYGAFSSNVHMKSGAPVFGTPEHIKTNFGAGQLARHLGLPWRSGGGTASNCADVQADYETQQSVWSSVLAGANLIFHSAGWLEGGLSFCFEKFISDIELLQTLAETMSPVPFSDDEIGLAAMAEVEPGGHFFASPHTMERYATLHYEPLLSDWRNHGNWTEAGSVQTTDRASAIWQKIDAEFVSPVQETPALGQAYEFLERRKAEGGSPAVS